MKLRAHANPMMKNDQYWAYFDYYTMYRKAIDLFEFEYTEYYYDNKNDVIPEPGSDWIHRPVGGWDSGTCYEEL